MYEKIIRKEYKEEMKIWAIFAFSDSNFSCKITISSEFRKINFKFSMGWGRSRHLCQIFRVSEGLGVCTHHWADLSSKIHTRVKVLCKWKSMCDSYCHKCHFSATNNFVKILHGRWKLTVQADYLLYLWYLYHLSPTLTNSLLISSFFGKFKRQFLLLILYNASLKYQIIRFYFEKRISYGNMFGPFNTSSSSRAKDVTKWYKPLQNAVEIKPLV